MAYLIYLSRICKLNMNCTTGLKVSTTADSKFNMEACHTHHGHPMELPHIWLSKQGWQEIASKIQQEVPADKILDEIHQSMPNNLHRHHILDKKDINNIQQAYCLKEIQHHPNDHQCPGMNWGMKKLAWHKSHHFSQDARRGKCRPGSLHWLNPRDNGLQL